MLASQRVGSIHDDHGWPLHLVSIYRKSGDDPADNDTIINGDRILADDGTSSDRIESWVQQASELLQRQWPRKSAGGAGDPMPSCCYRDKIIDDARTPTSYPYSNFPCSYLLIADGQCVGHGRLTECFESSGGNAAAVTFLVIDESKRGQKLGTVLMRFLEEEAKRLGYHYIYLWTTMAIGFYEKIGYEECHRVSLKRECLKSLDSSQVEGLEGILLRRRKKGDMKPHPTETILLARCDGEDANVKDTWMRKRLVEHVGSQTIVISERLAEMRAAVARVQQSRGTQCAQWRYLIRPVPWQPQIGPSCGLVALRMVREYFLSQSSISLDHTVRQLPSLLMEAKARGYTKDGEIFDANNLAELANEVCDVDCDVKSFRSLKPADVMDGLFQGGIWIVPYDSNRRTKLPGYFEGKNAHYGIIVGVLGNMTGPGNDVVGENGDASLELEEIELNPEFNWFDSQHSGSLFLLVQHGLSSALSIATFEEFLASNTQLESLDSRKFGSQHLDLQDHILLCTDFRSP